VVPKSWTAHSSLERMPVLDVPAEVYRDVLVILFLAQIHDML
jgi:hypothetical protein